MAAGFIEKHDLWSAEQKRQAQALAARAEKDGLKLFRLAWPDPHGASRAKTLTPPAFLSALRDGHNINVATTTLDASGARIFASFTPGGGMGLEEMTGSPNLVAVPDPETFRVLPFEPHVGWVLCDTYFTSGAPFHFSPRQVLRRQLARLAERGMACMIGLEVEWYLRRVADERLSDEHVGLPGLKGRAIGTEPVEPGFSYHSESNFDLLQPVANALADAFEKLRLPVRSIEKEWGAGQLECTFAPTRALEAADNLVLFRTVTRQICRRLGYLATFMCWPNVKGAYPSGWHLHQSLISEEDGQNLFMPKSEDEFLSPLGGRYLGGLLHHARAGAVFGNPTVNGYRRFRQNSLAPDRVSWGSDHRGTMLRVLANVGDPASRIENRIGEPWANPYLYIASQVIAGLDGIDRERAPGPADTDPYATQHPMLPKSLGEALELLEKEPLFVTELGDVFTDYYLRFKRSELGRFDAFVRDNAIDLSSSGTTEWEQNEYFDFF
jgi:glutamine synthetase